MSRVIEVLNRRGITPHTVDSLLGRASTLDLSELIGDLRHSTQGFQKPAEISPYSFVANCTLSGTGGCLDHQCRVERAEQLGVFSALYADQVYFHLHSLTEHWEHRLANDQSFLRHELTSDLKVVLRLAPLIEAGIMRLMPPEVGLCHSCASRLFGESGHLLDMDRWEDHYIQRSNVHIRRLQNEDIPYEIIVQSDDLLEHLRGFRTNSLAGEIAAKAQPSLIPDEYLGMDDVKRLGIVRSLIKQGLRESQHHIVSSSIFGTHYLTDRPFDAHFIESLKLGSPNGRGPLPPTSRPLPLYELPILSDVRVSQVLKMRVSEPDAFFRYRNALGKAASEQREHGESVNPREIYDDIIYPELERLRSDLRENRRNLFKKILGEFSIVATLAGIGSLSHMFPDDPKTLFLALGLEGTRFAISLRDQWARDQKAIKENAAYFVWRSGKGQ